MWWGLSPRILALPGPTRVRQPPQTAKKARNVLNFTFPRRRSETPGKKTVACFGPLYLQIGPFSVAKVVCVVGEILPTVHKGMK